MNLASNNNPVENKRIKYRSFVKHWMAFSTTIDCSSLNFSALNILGFERIFHINFSFRWLNFSYLQTTHGWKLWIFKNAKQNINEFTFVASGEKKTTHKVTIQHPNIISKCYDFISPCCLSMSKLFQVICNDLFPTECIEHSHFPYSRHRVLHFDEVHKNGIMNHDGMHINISVKSSW